MKMQNSSRLKRGLLTLGALALAALCSVASPADAASQDLNASERQRLMYQIRPATVMIAWELNAAITLPGTEGPITLQTSAGGMGSGWIITPDGYVVTNGHVVLDYHQYEENHIKRGMLAKALTEGGYFEQRASDIGRQLTEDEMEQEIDDLYEPERVNIGGELRVALQNGRIYDAFVRQFSGPINAYTGNLSIGHRFSATTGQDVAILKIPGQDLPTLTLGGQETVRVGEQVFVAGFPGAVVNSGSLSQENVLEASVLPGQIAAVRGSVQGADLLQIDATVARGNSGGPVVDGSGAVLGIATMGSTDMQSAAGFNFAVPATTIRQFVNAAGVTLPAPESMFNRTWSAALDLYYAGDNSGAVPAFDEVLRVMPDLPDALDLRREAMANPNPAGPPVVEEEVTPAPVVPQPAPDPGPPAWLIPVLALGVLLVGGGLMMRKSPAPATAGSAPRAGSSAASAAATVVAPAAAAATGSLMAIEGSLKGNKFEIESGGLTIGRDPSVCQIVLSEAAVSREHAVIRPNGSSFTIKNLSGTNPTYVNDRAIQETGLKKGDKVKVGDSVFTVEVS